MTRMRHTHRLRAVALVFAVAGASIVASAGTSAASSSDERSDVRTTDDGGPIIKPPQKLWNPAVMPPVKPRG